MTRRKIVEIDETRCNGCGLCVPSCAEGAIQIVGGKARLVSDVYCDGLGACLGECPQGAISVVERDVAAFDEAAAQRHAATIPAPHSAAEVLCGCPGTRVQDLRVLPVGYASAYPNDPNPAQVMLKHNLPGVPVRPAPGDPPEAPRPAPSALGNWPIQLHLVPPGAPFLRNADLLLVADCVPFALADFHERFLRGRPVVIACPKLDNTEPYVQKLAAMLLQSSIRSLTVVHMEVPCCMGLVRIAQAARQIAGLGVPLDEVVISTRGEVLPRA
jgi:Pyruvate/2-oxoacid:ferredoxin oxidoreductase delta subunit